MLKKILSFFIGFFMWGLVGILGVILILRMVFEPSSMTSLVKAMFLEDGGIVEGMISEGTDPEFAKYIDEEELEAEIGKFISDYFGYSGGAKGVEKPSTEGIRVLFAKYIDSYAKENDIDYDEADVDEVLDYLDLDLEEMVNEPVDEDVALVFKFIYSDTLLVAGIIIVIACILLDYALRKNWFIIMRHCGIVFIVNALGSLAIGQLMKLAIEESVDSMDIAIVDILVNCCNTFSMIILALGFGLIVLSICLKKNNVNMNQSQNKMVNTYNA